MATCLDCGKELIGRKDKKFCSPYCKSAYHYLKNKDKDKGLYHKIDHQLKLNRRILRKYNKAGKATVRCGILLKEGFDPSYFTHGWRAPNNRNLYLFCYEFGFMKTEENGKKKYVLVTWQSYMEKSKK